MKALVLAGGTGTRLRPFTYSRSKQLVPVAGRPVIHHVLDSLSAISNLTDVGIIVGDTANDIMSSIGTGGMWGKDFTYIRQDEPLGLAHAIIVAEDFLGDDDFVMLLGDNLFQNGIGALDTVRDINKVLFARVEDLSSYGVGKFKNGKLEGLVEKPVWSYADHDALALTGAYRFSPVIHEAVRSIEFSARGELEITDAIQWLMNNGHEIYHETIDGWWVDVGKQDSLMNANRLMLDAMLSSFNMGNVDDLTTLNGPVSIHPNALVTNSTLIGPCVIGNNADISSSIVGPHSVIGVNTSLTTSKVTGSVIMDGCQILNSNLIGSIIGNQSVVNMGHPGYPKQSSCMMIGDESTVIRS